MNITHASSAEERMELRDFLAEHLHDIAPDAVPKPEWDRHYETIALTVREEGKLIAGLLSCYTQIASAAFMAPEGIDEHMDKVRRLTPLHAELDLIAVDPSARSTGIGSALISESESILKVRGTKYWFGCVTSDLDVDRLRNFYEKLGFTVLPDGARLPPFKGVEWVPPHATDAAFWFYKRLER
ncbi:GNAT family N-acetyltransferase [Brachybacterium sacelli]|uniref:Ribosomal protein S18 acetylase RimI-like enzyme n=1 Tax=Brachybacterium sacelli TaxID=173364 RepID=A0ABS4X7X8_9MICO|nr:GNAT family N-acetyltransferase [Brachybacterium sacelli]MBP2384451.1 ribosomal protein S18 acetylase RimI-like enzyme [Brachybacterium sacelli]